MSSLFSTLYYSLSSALPLCCTTQKHQHVHHWPHARADFNIEWSRLCISWLNFDTTNALGGFKLTQLVYHTEGFVVSRFAWLDTTVLVASKNRHCSEDSLNWGSPIYRVSELARLTMMCLFLNIQSIFASMTCTPFFIPTLTGMCWPCLLLSLLVVSTSKIHVFTCTYTKQYTTFKQCRPGCTCRVHKHGTRVCRALKVGAHSNLHCKCD